MNGPMDWEEAFKRTEASAQKSADRAKRLLGAVSEIKESQHHLSSQVKAILRLLDKRPK